MTGIYVNGVQVITSLRELQNIATAFNNPAAPPGRIQYHFMARAWVNFDGSGTVSIREDGNVSSVVDIGVGKYEVIFNTSMTAAVNDSYCVVGSARRADGLNTAAFSLWTWSFAPGQVSCVVTDCSNGTPLDPTICNLIVVAMRTIL